jgi:adenosylhomocysteine nucleosidase
MPGKTIGLVAAMPEEIRPLLRRAGKLRREHVSGFDLYRFAVGDRETALIQSGIGAEKAARATGILIDAVAPGMILNFGFAGAVLPGPRVGDVVMADRLLFFKERHFTEEPGLHRELSGRLALLLETACRGKDFSFHRGTFVTTGEIVAKQRLAGLLPEWTGNPVLEMETAAVARTAARAVIPLVALRAVSDVAEEELGFTIGEITDHTMNISAAKLLRTIAGKPRIIPQLIRLARNSRIAGRNLAVAVVALLENLPNA